MTDPLAPIDPIRISAPTPAHRLQPVTRDRGDEQGRRNSDERREEPEEQPNGEGPHVDVLA